LNHQPQDLTSKAVTYLRDFKLELNQTFESLGFYNRLLATARAQNPEVKVLLGLGGWTDSTNGQKYSKLVNDEPSRKNFVEKTVKMLEIRGFDGLSLEWHFPVCWQSDCKSGNPSDKSGFTSFVKVGKRL
jgi:chitinase